MTVSVVLLMVLFPQPDEHPDLAKVKHQSDIVRSSEKHLFGGDHVFVMVLCSLPGGELPFV